MLQAFSFSLYLGSVYFFILATVHTKRFYAMHTLEVIFTQSTNHFVYMQISIS